MEQTIITLIQEYAAMPFAPQPNNDKWGIPFMSDAGIGVDLQMALAEIDTAAMSDNEYDNHYQDLHSIYCKAWYSHH